MSLQASETVEARKHTRKAASEKTGHANIPSRSGLSSLTLEASNALLSPLGSHRRKQLSFRDLLPCGSCPRQPKFHDFSQEVPPLQPIDEIDEIDVSIDVWSG